MSRAPVVDERYSLQPGDLAGNVRRVVIQNVSYQGVEELTPVLHFAQAALRPLPLDVAQRSELIRLSHSALSSDWIGSLVELRVTQHNGQPRIVLTTPNAPNRVRDQLDQLRSIPWPRLRSFLLLLLLAVMLIALYLLENSETAWQTLYNWLR
jgi:hypothetical protein